ncbi:MBL fold metallo-hydrolase [Paenibacillus sp. N3.4]|uniref:MBL fold metallo-hydrolase n=1 Tax=Paenibacillus sp. N3.4 TaxID=2603222 RepID=UPI0011CB7E2C|nr:MBL fold metallo-hydrolase [Paenibacillus sp. N3.4]TXK71249.1 MBL fold metallo-hydrolase [Paenibacillus sp. N3.4]
MKLANGLYMLELSVPVMGQIDVIYPTLLVDEGGAILVDTGFPGLFPTLRQAMEQEDVQLSQLHTILITHQDLDHIGSLPTFLSESPQFIEVLASEIEKPYIQGEKMLIKITSEKIEEAVNSLPSHVTPEWRNAFRATLENPPKAPVTGLLHGGQELHYAGGIVVIDTPGHTPGHLSLYHKASKTLIAGDAMIVTDGQLHRPVPEQASDYNLAVKSLKKFTDFDIHAVICYHGGLFKHNVNQRISELAL